MIGCLMLGFQRFFSFSYFFFSFLFFYGPVFWGCILFLSVDASGCWQKKISILKKKKVCVNVKLSTWLCFCSLGFCHAVLWNLFSGKMLRINQGISRLEDAKTNATEPGADCFFFFFFLLLMLFLFLCSVAFPGLACTPRLDFDVND